MSFLFPTLLTIGLALVALPVLIHLINMMRHRRIQWAAMEFLLISQKKNRTWILLKQLLLLLLRMGAVQARECLHRFDARKDLVHVHCVEERLVVAGLELVGANQEPVGVFTKALWNRVAWKRVERGLGDPFCPPTRARRRKPRWPCTGSFVRSGRR